VAIDDVSLSPSGTHIAYINEKNGVRYLYDFDLATKKARSFELGTAVVSSIRWLTDIHILVTTELPSRLVSFDDRKGEYRISTVFNLEKGTQNTLYANMQFFQGFTTGLVRRIQVDGRWQVTACSYSNDKNDDYFYLHRFDLDSGKSWLMDRAPLETREWLFTETGEMVARSVYYSKTRRWAAEHFSDGTWKEIYSFRVERLSPALSGFTADGKALIVTIPGEDVSTYHELTFDGVLGEGLTEEYSRKSALFHPLTLRLQGFSRFDGWPHYEYSDPVMKDIAAKAEKAVAGYRFILSDYADDPHKTIVYTEGDDDAGTYYFIDFASGASLEVGAVYPDMPWQWISNKKLISYKASDGLDISGYLSLPPNRAPKSLPLIVMPHDGPRGQTGQATDWLVQALTSSGYAVLQPNYRGSTNGSRAFVEAGYGQWGRKMQTDLSDGVKALSDQGLVHAKRVAIMGWGFGGYMALAGITLQDGIYKCAIDIAGIADMEFYSSKTALAGRFSPAYKWFTRWTGEASDMQAISPKARVQNVTVPVLIMHNIEDTSEDYQESVHMRDALKSAGKDVTFYSTKAPDSWMLIESWRVDFVKAVTGFMAAHNPA